MLSFEKLLSSSPTEISDKVLMKMLIELILSFLTATRPCTLCTTWNTSSPSPKSCVYIISPCSYRYPFWYHISFNLLLCNIAKASYIVQQTWNPKTVWSTSDKHELLTGHRYPILSIIYSINFTICSKYHLSMKLAFIVTSVAWNHFFLHIIAFKWNDTMNIGFS